MLPFLLRRLLEPSSYAGAVLAEQAIKAMVIHGPTLSGVGAALGGIAAFLVPEGAAASSSQPKV